MDSTEQDHRAQQTRAVARPERTGEAGSAASAPVLPPLDEFEAFVNAGRWTWDIATGSLTCTPQLLRVYGLASPDLMPNADSFLLRTHQADRMRVRASIMRSTSSGEPFQFQQRIVRADDAVCVLRTRGNVERGTDGQPLRIHGMSQDVTDLHAADQKAQQRFRLVTSRTLDREEDDRRRIVKELRERVAEPLVTLGRRLADFEAMEEPARTANSIAAATLQMMGQLRPSVLEEHGLLAALRAEGLRLSRQAAIPISVAGDEITPRLPVGVETALFRIAQEAMDHAAKHSACTLIRVSLTGSPRQVRLDIQDDGARFDTASQSGEAVGVSIMRERAEAVGATFRLNSQLGNGARITVDYRG